MVSISTNGDPFLDAAHVGIVVGEHRTYCRDCYKKHIENANDALGRRITQAYHAAGMCGFVEAYLGRCRNAAPCSMHASQRCWKCGGVATKNCCSAGSQFVCGEPECAEHPHINEH